MVITKEVLLPEFKHLTVEEVNVSSATLMAAAPHLGKACESINNEFMLCRHEHNDPRCCVPLGKKVTECTLLFFKQVKKCCYSEFNQYANCIDKSSGRYEPWHCRKTQAIFDGCMNQKLNIARPHFGYFTRARIHDSSSARPCCPECPTPDGPQPSLQDCKERKPARFTARNYWATE